MANMDQNKPTGKPGQRNKKGEPRRPKPDQRKELKPDQRPAPMPDQLLRVEAVQPPETQEKIEQLVASAVAPPIEAVAPIETVAPVETTPPIETVAPIETAAPANAAPVNLQTIANAYGDYARKSFDEMRSFFEQFTGVRSVDKAVKVQTEFAKRSYETFVSESQKIGALHNQLAKQSFKPLQGFAFKRSRDTQ